MNDKEVIINDDPQHRQEAFEKLLDVALEHDYLDEASQLISKAHIADLAGFLDRTTSDQKEKILSLLSDQQISEVIIEIDISVIPLVIKMIGDEKVAKIIDFLDVDDAIYVLDSLDDGENQLIINHLKGKTQRDLKEGLSYPEGSAGRLMQKNSSQYLNIGPLVKQSNICSIKKNAQRYFIKSLLLILNLPLLAAFL